MPKQTAILFGPLPPPSGGVAVFMSKLAKYAIDRGVRIWGYSEVHGDKSVTWINYRRLGHIKPLHKEGRGARITDSTHFHLEYPHWLLLPLWLVAKRALGFTWVKVLHDGTLPGRSKNFGFVRSRLFRLALKNVDEYVPVSNELARWLRDDIGAEQEIRVIPALLPGWGELFAPPLGESSKDILARFSDHERRFCSIGVFAPVYGFHHVAESIEQVRIATGLDIGLLLVDGGHSSDAEFRNSVLNNREWIHVVSNIPHTALHGILSSCTAFVRGFALEGYGLSRIEALWSGVPVIAAISTENRGMLSYEFGDVATLKEHIMAVMNGDRAPDAEAWSETFHNDAEQYLQAHLRSLTCDKSNLDHSFA
jgi:glycosyltransferase involved in cell wall biosynthesis